MKDVVRCVLAKESTVLSVCGPASWFAMYEEGARRRAEPKLAYAERELMRFCQKLGVHYLPLDAVPGPLPPRTSISRTGFTVLAVFRGARAEAEGRAMATAWRLAHAEVH